ncbi:molybdate-anion transporter isoform X2 [Ananas comosus]|uniref:Molybdate-anion transporter isoform X2 n=1 Tax=Ananas comosus TaxID=4615 RepID=A0A6P5F256_ANACO|nr:molybdate-anion transporter isoform X2 [Ananas comosus]
MTVVIEREEWELNPLAYVFLFVSCFASIFLCPYFSKGSAKGAASAYPFDLGPSAPFLRFQRSFLLIYSIASVLFGASSYFPVIEVLQTISGEYEYMQYGLGREQMALVLAAGAAGGLFLGTFSGILFDMIGPRNACMLYCVLHLLVGLLKTVRWLRSMWVESICLALASSVFHFCFETWMVTEHEKHGHKQDLLNDTFWLMTFYESASLVGSQGVANILVKDLHKKFSRLGAFAALFAIITILYIRKAWKGNQDVSIIGSYRKSFSAHVLRDKKIWILVWAQASIHFSVVVFWFLWAPTIVADGREVHLSRIYPCFIGSRMLGSTAFPLFSGIASSLHTEDSLTASFVIAAAALSIVVYDYQEIGLLVILFCIFHACVGFILPSLAKLRYLPNELRGGMITLSLAPANAVILLVLINRAYNRSIENSTIMALAACGLLTAGACIHILRRWRKHPRQNWRNL